MTALIPVEDHFPYVDVPNGVPEKTLLFRQCKFLSIVELDADINQPGIGNKVGTRTILKLEYEILVL